METNNLSEDSSLSFVTSLPRLPQSLNEETVSSKSENQTKMKKVRKPYTMCEKKHAEFLCLWTYSNSDRKWQTRFFRKNKDNTGQCLLCDDEVGSYKHGLHQHHNLACDKVFGNMRFWKEFATKNPLFLQELPIKTQKKMGSVEVYKHIATEVMKKGKIFEILFQLFNSGNYSYVPKESKNIFGPLSPEASQAVFPGKMLLID